MICIFLQVFSAIFSGIMEALAISNEISPLGSPFLGLFCLIPIYTALYKAKNYRESFFLFFLQVLTVHLISSIWLKNFHGYAAFTLGASAAGTAFEGGVCGLIFHALPHSLNKTKIKFEENGGKHSWLIPLRIFYFSSVWVFWEWTKSTGAMGYPWGTLFMSAYKWKIFCQIADISGVWGITFLWSLVSALFAEGLRLLYDLPKSQNPLAGSHYYTKSAKVIALFFLVTFVYGIFKFFEPRRPFKSINIVAVQQNIDPWETEENQSINISKKLTEEKIAELKARGQKADIVLWSEGVLGHSFPRSRVYYENNPKDESLTAFIKRMGVPFIIGGSVRLNIPERKYANAAILFDSDGTYSAFYNKRHLVPFAEGIPYLENPLMHFFMKEVVGFTSTYTSGSQNIIFKIPLSSYQGDECPLEYTQERDLLVELDKKGRSDQETREKFIQNKMENPQSFALFSTPICFEDSFNDICRPLYIQGSEIFLNITNDSWSKMEAAEYQHFIVSSFRAIEYRIPLLRCTNSGCSAIVDPAGRVSNMLPLFTQSAFAASIPLYKRQVTYYAKYGDVFAYTLFLFIALVFVCVIYEDFIKERIKK